MDEQKKSLLERIFDKAVQLALHTAAVYKLKGYRKISEAFAFFFTGLIVGAIFLALLIFVSIGFAIYIGIVLGKLYYGFFIVGATYGIICAFVYLAGRKAIKNKLHNYFIGAFFKVEEDA